MLQQRLQLIVCLEFWLEKKRSPILFRHDTVATRIENHMKRTVRTFWPWLGFLLLICLFLGPALVPGKVLLPLDVVTQVWPPWQQPNQIVEVHNPLITDVVDYIFPLKAFVAEQVKLGKLPLWNPYVLAGYPLTYNTQAGLFYPLSLFYYLLAPVTAVDGVIFAQLFLGAAFMFAYLRQLKLRRIAAWVGTAVFLFNGMMIVWLEWQVVHAAVIWLPLQLLFLERIGQKWATLLSRTEVESSFWLTAPEAVAAGVAFAIPWLGGHWNWTLYGSMTAVLYMLWRWGPLFWTAVRAKKWRQGRLVAGTAVFVLGLGVALSLVQVLPAFNYLLRGHRDPFAFGDSLRLGLKASAVVALIPDFFGSPIDQNWWGQTNYNETAFYVGLLPLFLVIMAIWLRRDRMTGFFAAWGGLGLLWALGTPVYGLLYVLPVFNGLWPSRAMTVLLFCTAILSGLGLDALLVADVNWQHVRRTAVIVGSALLGIVAGFVWWYRPDLGVMRPELVWFGLSLLVCVTILWLGPERLRPAGFAAVAAGWIVLELFLLGHDYNTVGNVADLYPETETAVFLRSDPEPFRITTLPEGIAYPPNTALQARLQNMSGYEPAILQNIVNYVQAAEGSEAIYFERELMPLRGLDSPLIDAMNVKYVVTINDWYQELSMPGEAQPEVTQWVTLAADAPTSQPFSVPDAGLHRLDIPLQFSADAVGTITARIFSANGRQEFAHADWLADQPLEDGWASFYFSVFPSEWGRDFLLTLTFVGTGLAEVGGSSAGLAFRNYYLPRPQLVHESGKTRVYLNDGFFPRAYIVPTALPATNEAEALALVQQQADSLTELVVLETDGKEPPQWQTAVTSASEVAVTRYDLNEVVLEAVSDDAGFVVLADAYYPGWRATIDGEETPVYRANSVVRAVYVPEGSHTITFSFLPGDFVWGTAVSGLALLLAMGVATWGWVKNRSI